MARTLEGFEMKKKCIVLRYQNGEVEISPDYYRESEEKLVRQEVSANTDLIECLVKEELEKYRQEAKVTSKNDLLEKISRMDFRDKIKILVTNRETERRIREKSTRRYETLRVTLKETVENIIKGS